MQKILLTLCLALVVANVKGSNEYHLDEYINLNRIQHAHHLESYDAKLQQFAEQYQDRISAVNLRLELINNELKQTDERLSPLKVLSPFNKECVLKYSDNIPTAFDVENKFTQCVTSAQSQLSVMLEAAYNVRNNLETYFKNLFEQEFKRCAALNDSSEQISCVTNLSIHTNNVIADNQKNFDTEVAAAVCSAKNNIHKVVDCCFNVQENATAEISSSSHNIERCILNRGQCDPCLYCETTLKLSVDNLADKTMANPFYLDTYETNCVIAELDLLSN